jgi:hypothetical protein
MKKKTLKSRIEETKFKEAWHGWYWHGHCQFYCIEYEEKDQDALENGHGPFADFLSCQADARIYYTAEKSKIEQSLRKIELSKPD